MSFRGVLGSLFVLLILWTNAEAEIAHLVIGGAGTPWADLVEQWIALDDTTYPGAIQPREIRSGENILRSAQAKEGEQKNIFGYGWSVYKGQRDMEAREYELGWHPRIWSGGAAEASGSAGLIDGDGSRPAYSGSSGWLTVDLGIALPVDRVRFFPPQQGMDKAGRLYKDLYPRGYAVSLALMPVDWLLYEAEKDALGSIVYHPLHDVVKETFGNTEAIIGVGFEPRFARFVRLFIGGVIQDFSLAEIEVYGRGFPAVARYISKPIPFTNPVSFGKVWWKFIRFRRTSDGEIIEDPDAPVRFRLQTRSGMDDDPKVYHVYDELGKQQVVDRATYRAAPSAVTGAHQVGVPGYRGAVIEDTENWDPWSSLYRYPGEDMRSLDARAYLQFKLTVETDDPFAFGRLDSLAFEYAPLLAGNVVGELSLLEQPDPPGGILQIPTGVITTFAYDVRATFDSPEQSGFDAIELDVPPNTAFLRLEMGDPLAAVTPDSVVERSEMLIVYFPSRRITRGTNIPFRVLFRAAVFYSSVYFTGDVLDVAGDHLPQSITPGNANAEVSTNDFRVLASGTSLDVLSPVQISPRAMTPNGDGADDQTTVSFSISGSHSADISVEVYNLAGRKVRTLHSERGGAGRYAERWDGKNGDGDLVSPGIYLVRVKVDVDAGVFERTQALFVLY